MKSIVTPSHLELGDSIVLSSQNVHGFLTWFAGLFSIYGSIHVCIFELISSSYRDLSYLEFWFVVGSLTRKYYDIRE